MKWCVSVALDQPYSQVSDTPSAGREDLAACNGGADGDVQIRTIAKHLDVVNISSLQLRPLAFSLIPFRCVLHTLLSTCPVTTCAASSQDGCQSRRAKPTRLGRFLHPSIHNRHGGQVLGHGDSEASILRRRCFGHSRLCKCHCLIVLAHTLLTTHRWPHWRLKVLPYGASRMAWARRWQSSLQPSSRSSSK